jgi:tetratricopeptide (TPR) repeat protein
VSDPELDAADALAQAGRHEEALAALGRLAAARPGDWLVVVRRAAILVNLGRDAEALAEADRVAALAPGEPAAHAERAMLLVLLGRAAAAEDAAREALRLDPGHLDGLYVGARASAEAHRGERALAYGWHAINVAPGNPTALRAYATGLTASHRWPEAEQTWRSLLLAAPGDVEATRGLIAALSAQGRHDHARELAEGLPEEAPGRPDHAARAYRGDATWVAVAGGLVAAGLLLGHPGGFGPVGTVLLVLLGLGYALVRRRTRHRVPVTARTREVVAGIDRSRDRAVAGVAGGLAILAGAGWLVRSPHTPVSLGAGAVLLLGGLVALGAVLGGSRHRP